MCAIPLWAGLLNSFPGCSSATEASVQHKDHTGLGNSQPDPRAFCTLTIYPGSKSSVGKLELIVSKGTNLSYFTPPLTSGLTFARVLHSVSVLTFLWVWKMWWSHLKDNGPMQSCTISKTAPAVIKSSVLGSGSLATGWVTDCNFTLPRFSSL